ncbi:MAG: DNA-methyltransferase [Bradyrhizobium sp.]|uniref:DNA-methyltransferase n=1 Tax=Bradyrhizobium sp. TaxID=376 RepID=UPI003BF36FE9
MSAPETFCDGRVTLHRGDMLGALAGMAEGSIDGCVTDPPYFLPEMEKRFGSPSAARAKGEMFSRGAKGAAHGKGAVFGDIANRVETWAAILRVLKPGGWVLAFNYPKAYARMQVAAEDAGFEARDVFAWHYGTGFPHGKPLGKFVDRALLGDYLDDDELARGPVTHAGAFYGERDITTKPATELIMLARKPLEGTITENLLTHGAGSLDVTGCRVQHETGSSFPSNLLHDGSPEIVAGFPLDAGGLSVARFFWHPKAGEQDRAGSGHPTVKPIALMRYLVRLATRPGDTVLDPFAGSGTTGEAAICEGRRAVLIEIDPQFQDDIANRMRTAFAGPDERARQLIKAKGAVEAFEPGTLFAGL